MDRNDFRRKLGSLLLQVQAIEEKQAAVDILRMEDAKNNIFNGPAHHLYFALFDEKYALQAKIGKLQDKYHKAGFTAQQWCEDYNRYIDMYRMEVK